MNDQLSILQAITQNFVHRVGREQLIRDLPTKHEHVVLLRLSPAQEIIYNAYLEVCLSNIFCSPVLFMQI